MYTALALPEETTLALVFTETLAAEYALAIPEEQEAVALDLQSPWKEQRLLALAPTLASAAENVVISALSVLRKLLLLILQ